MAETVKIVRTDALRSALAAVKVKMEDAAYTLPAASATVLGGVKVGSNINVSGGTISVPQAAAATPGVITENRVNTLAEAKAKAAVAEVVNVAPAELDTLKELADYLTDDTLAGGVVKQLAAKADKATTLAGYGITDCKIASGVITIGSATITPLTQHQSLAAYSTTAQMTTAINNAVSGKANTADVYSKTAADSTFVKSASLTYMTEAEAAAMVTEIFG